MSRHVGTQARTVGAPGTQHCRRRAGILATTLMSGLLLNFDLGCWWADPVAGNVLVFYAAREVREI